VSGAGRSAGPHVVVAVSAHGWGHLAQALPMAAALHARMPGLRTTVATGLPAALVRARFGAIGLPAPAVVPDEVDFGLVMHDALHIDLDASLARHRASLAARDRLLSREIDRLAALGADAVLSDVGWLPIAAAHALGLPAWGASSLNWADVLDELCEGRADAAPVTAWMREGYARARALFALEPGMPFDGFANRARVAPIARRGACRRAELRGALDATPDARVLVVAFGGLAMRLDTSRWRLPAGWHAVVFAEGVVESATVADGTRLGWPFLDAMASSDLLVAKPGYGTFAEAGFEGRDTLAVPRGDWPETRWLVDWLGRHARCAPIALEALRDGAFEAPIAAIAALAARPPARGDGAAAIAEAIATGLGAEPPFSRPGTGGRTAG
jgi:hypothetical protein